jgi:hypothetical protein
MDDIKLIKKLIRRHRQELNDLIGHFRVKTSKDDYNSVQLLAGGTLYRARAVKGDPDWLAVNDIRGRAIATLN